MTKLAAYITFGILSLVVIFHLLVLGGVIPFQIVWGGRLDDHTQLISFELVSIMINLLMLFIVGIKAGIIRLKVNKTIIRISLWLMFILFVLNTIGNLLSQNQFEKLFFTPQTFILSLLCLKLALTPDTCDLEPDCHG